MIGRLAGRLDYRATDHVLIDVGGVGYLVFCSERTMASLPRAGEAVALYTDLLVRDDLMQLYGFTTLVEKEWHRLLMSVQGVGAKASLAILGVLGADGVGRAIALGDVSAVKAAKGIGPKTAQRVVLELKDKAPDVMAMAANDANAAFEVGSLPTSAGNEPVVEGDVEQPRHTDRPVTQVPPKISSQATAQAEALSGLTNLGYPPGDAAAAVAQAMDGATEAEKASTPDIIRAALRYLAPKV